MFEQNQRKRRLHKREFRPLLVATGKRLNCAFGLAADVERRDSFLRHFDSCLAVDEHPFGFFRKDEVVGKAQAGHKRFLQSRGRQKVYASAFENVVSLPGQILAIEFDSAADWSNQP